MIYIFTVLKRNERNSNIERACQLHEAKGFLHKAYHHLNVLLPSKIMADMRMGCVRMLSSL